MITPRHPAENLSIVHQTQTATQLANLNRNGRKPGARNKPSGVAERVRRSAAAKTALCIRTLAALRPPPSPERCRCHAAAAAFDLTENKRQRAYHATNAGADLAEGRKRDAVIPLMRTMETEWRRND